MSRLRRLLTSEKIFFITCNLLPARSPFVNADFVCLAEALRSVRIRWKFLLAGYVFMPEHWHALIAPAENDALPLVMNAVKVAAMRRINSRRGAQGPLWQPRYYDEIIWRVKQFNETLRYMHFNAVVTGLVANPEDWRWSSFRCFGDFEEINLEIDRLVLPADDDARL